jgi:flagellar hook-length control protein FliK
VPGPSPLGGAEARPAPLDPPAPAPAGPPLPVPPEGATPLGEPALEARGPDPLAGDEAAPRETPRGDATRPAGERAPLQEAAAPDAARVREAAPRSEAARPQPAPAAQHEQAADILRQVRLQLSPHLRQATIQLEPASLGRLDIRLEVRRGRVRAELAVERPETLHVLERHAPELRASLAAAGFDQAELSLSLAQQDRGPERQPSPAGGPRAPRTTAGPDQPALHDAVARRLAHDGAVDTYA